MKLVIYVPEICVAASFGFHCTYGQYFYNYELIFLYLQVHGFITTGPFNFLLVSYSTFIDTFIEFYYYSLWYFFFLMFFGSNIYSMYLRSFS